MKNILFAFAFIFVLFPQIATAQNCVYLDPITPDFPIMCFTDPTTMDGDEISLTAAQFNDDAFIMSLIQTNFIDAFGFAGGLTVDCDMNATVKIIRKRFTSNTTASSRNGAALSEITFSTSSVVGACDNQTLSLKISVAQNIPTFSQWSLFIFGLLLLNLGIFSIKKKQAILS